jgi:hypothetical protein
LLSCGFGQLSQAVLVRDPGEGVAADGTITTGAARSRVPPPFEPVLSTAVEAIAAADARAARGFNGDIAEHAARWRDALAAGAEPRRLGRQLARKTLLAVAGLVSVQDATWTTDRALAAHRWAEIEPELGPALHALLAWSDGLALPGRAALRHMLDAAIPPITAAFATTIGLWP